MSIPQRIVCLTAEVADWLWRIGAWEQVAGVTAWFAAPPGAPPRPRVGGFSHARPDDIAALDPDLVITFSDVQAGLAAELIRRGLTVLATNQRTLAETEATLDLLARVAGREAAARPLLAEFRARLAPVPEPPRRPRVYFEEWPDPPVSGIGWISELIHRAGGDDIFPAGPDRRAAAQRVVTPEAVLRADPDVILACWCGRPFQPERLAARPGWAALRAVREGRVFEVPAEDFLQPGFRLVFGLERLKRLLASAAWASSAADASTPASSGPAMPPPRG